MSVISANTVIELFRSLSEKEQKMVLKEITPKDNPKMVDSSTKIRLAVPTPAQLVQKHRAKFKTPAKC